MKKSEIAIIGAGPIGIELAVSLKQKGLEYIHFEAGQIGSTIAWYAPGTHFFSSAERISISGIPLETPTQQKATREEYLIYLRSVVRQFDLSIQTYQRVCSLTVTDTGFVVKTAKSLHGVGGPEEVQRMARDKTVSLPGEKLDSYLCKKIILTIGDMHHPSSLGIPGEKLQHVSHYFADPHQYFRKKVLIVGGKNSAVEAAIRLQRAGCEVTLSYRRRDLDAKRIKYWLYPELTWLIKNNQINFLAETEVLEIYRDSVLLQDNAKSKAKKILVEADFVLLLTGYEQDTTLFNMAGVTLEGPCLVPTFNKLTMETNVANLFVAGTAAAGTQRLGVKEFIETSHIHVERIISALTGLRPPEEREIDISQLES